MQSMRLHDVELHSDNEDQKKGERVIVIVSNVRNADERYLCTVSGFSGRSVSTGTDGSIIRQKEISRFKSRYVRTATQFDRFYSVRRTTAPTKLKCLPLVQTTIRCS